jgi:hypothetical protein
MKTRSFSLQPFPCAGTLPDLVITGSIARWSHSLAIDYRLHGHLAGLLIPAPAARPGRLYGLWQQTCFECFLGVKHSPCYWEINLSPAGHWNVYRFAAYRQGMREETAFTELPFGVQRQSDSLVLAVELPLGEIVEAGQPLEIAISAVIKRGNGEATHWALTHPGPQADFHRRDGFTLGV